MKKKIFIIIVLLIMSISLFATIEKELNGFVGKKVEVFLKNSAVSFKGILKSFDKDTQDIILESAKGKKILIYGGSVATVEEISL